MSDMSRHDLKKNELADVVVVAVTWIKNNRNLFFSIAGTVLAVIVLAIFFFTRYHALNARANDKVSLAQGMLAQGQAAQASGQLDEVINRYSRTPAAAEARMVKAELLSSQGNYAEAEKTILPATTGGKPKTMIPLACASLGTIQENEGKYQEAVKTYNNFLDRFPDHYLAPRIYESLGRAYELLGSAADAKATYEKLATLYPASGWAQHAQERIAALTGQKPPAPATPGSLPQPKS